MNTDRRAVQFIIAAQRHSSSRWPSPGNGRALLRNGGGGFGGGGFCVRHGGFCESFLRLIDG